MKKIGHKTQAQRPQEPAATVRKTERRKDLGLIRHVIKRNESITRKDIADWKRARQQATSSTEPKQVLLQHLFEEIMLDALMTSQISVLRVGKSQGAEFELKSNGKKDDVETQKLKDSGLYEDLVELIIEAQFFNHSVVEFSYDGDDLAAELIPRANISPEVGKFYPDTQDSATLDYRDLPEFKKWIVEVYPRKRDLGLLNKAVPYVLIKKFALSCWSELCEIFGIPPRVMKTNTTDNEMLERADMMMKEIGSAAYFIIDTTEEFEFAQGVATNGDVYKNLISTCDQQLSLLNLAAVLGQDTENGNRSKEESSTKLMEAVVKADKRLIESTFNKKILPALASIGFLKPGLRLEITKEVDLEKLWKMTYEASQYYEVDPEWIRNTFGIEVIGKKATAIVPPDDDKDPDDDDESRTEEGGKPGKTVDPDEEGQAFFVEAPQAGASGGNAPTQLNEGLIERVAAGQSTYWDAELFVFITRDLLNAIRTRFKTASPAARISYNVPDDVYTAAMEQNLFHFSAAKTLAEVQELNQAFRESKSYADFKNRATEITDTFNDKWQRTEYRTAIQVAEAASQYRQLRKSANTLPYWVYRTVGDGQVRPEHAALDGLTLPASDPEWSKIYPPNDWGCRCWVDAIMAEEFDGNIAEERQKVKTFMTSAEWKRATAQGWGVNRAETAEVFTANQMYVRKFPDRAAALVGKLYCQHYGLPSFGKRLAAATESFRPFTGDAAAWFAQNSRFKDISGKTVELPAKTFSAHTTGKYAAKRVPLLGVIGEVLEAPDEIWLNNYDGQAFNYYNYVKFYQGKAINVVCSIENGKMFGIKTWFEIEQQPTTKSGKKISRDKDPRLKYRRGLLVKK